MNSSHCYDPKRGSRCESGAILMQKEDLASGERRKEPGKYITTGDYGGGGVMRDEIRKGG